MEKGKYADVNGIKMYYEIHGEGKPLVLIHGGGSNIETTFGRTMPLFAKYFKVIAVELQAHGRTTDRNAPETFEQDAKDVVDLLKQLKIDKAFIFGFSNGGSTALQIAIRHSEIADKIVVASVAYKREGFADGFFEGLKNATLKDMPQPFQDAFLKLGNDAGALQNMFNKDKQRMLDFMDWHEGDLKRITAPVLIINTDKDVVLPEHSIKILRLIPNAQLIILPGMHGAFIDEGGAAAKGSKLPELAAELVKEFLNS